MCLGIARQKANEFLASLLGVCLGGADKDGNRFYASISRLVFVGVLFPVFGMVFQDHFKTLINGQGRIAFVGFRTDVIVDLLDVLVFRGVFYGIVVDNVGEIFILVVWGPSETNMPCNFFVRP